MQTVCVVLSFLCMKIEEVRQQTKAEKKRMAMAMREKQLVQLGMMVSTLSVLYQLLYTC